MTGDGAAAEKVLRGVSVRYGQWQDIDVLLQGDRVTPEGLAALKNGGLRRYSDIQVPVGSLYAEVLRETLDKTGVDPADVDAVVYFSSSFDAYQEQDDLAAACHDAGLTRAVPLGVFLGECTNYSSALLVASGLVDAHGFRTVMLLGADSMDEFRPGADRILGGNVAVFSDTVLSCLLDTGGGPGFVLERVAHRFDSELVGLDSQRDLVKFIDRFAGALGGVCQDLYGATGLGPEDFRHLVLPNMALGVLKNYADVARISFDKAYTGNVGTLGHCWAYDQLITLDTLRADGAVQDGDRLLALGVGNDFLFSATALRWSGPPAAGS